MFKNFIAGIGYLFQGISLISKKEIRPFVVIPLLVNIGVFSFAIWIAKAQFDTIMARLLGWLPSWLSWVEYLLYPLFAIVILVAIYYVFTAPKNHIKSINSWFCTLSVDNYSKLQLESRRGGHPRFRD